MDFNFKHARYFVAAARLGQVSRAAVELNVSQSAVTAAIQQLEALLGAPLLERRPTGVALTPAGSHFLRHAEQIIAAVNEATRIAVDTPAGIVGAVRIGVTYTVAGYFVMPLIHRVQRLFPGIDIILSEAERPEIEAALVAETIDLAVMLTSNLGNQDEIGHETLVRSQRRLWLPAEHALSRKGQVSLADVVNHPYIALTVDEAMKTQAGYWTKAGVHPNVVFQTSSVEAVRTMVAAGMGITVLSDMVYRPWSLEGQRIETCDLSDEIPTMDVGVAWKASRARSQTLLSLIDFLKRNADYEIRRARNREDRR
ncbi:LysR family transcriptional regulator [Labrys monachus]|uniref:DNA-binding transcriptional LysR family regulator n=1 Tax=Labrys monachus TaxID=217067 RepID=A0ABU0FA99_9HYPH|nr:LysR family transcriptional regulator [Labrys monachus]MDQ0390975.1 DNA-binding transcriptional LysR family regulator [Labrys monachus]